MRLNYREFGDGIPLIILHGLYGSSDNWISIARELSDSFRVILPDQRNHGASPHSATHSYDSMSDDLNDLVEDLEINNFFLAGHSMGGKTAMWYASKWPEKLFGMMVIDISPFRSGTEGKHIYDFHIKVLKSFISLPLDSILSREDADNRLSSEISSSRIRKFLLKNLTRNKDKKFIWKLNPENLADNIENILEGFDRKDYTSKMISGFPVVFVRAGESGYIPETDFNDIKLLFPASEIVTIDNTSHWIHAEKPEAIIELLKRLAE